MNKVLLATVLFIALATSVSADLSDGLVRDYGFDNEADVMNNYVTNATDGASYATWVSKGVLVSKGVFGGGLVFHGEEYASVPIASDLVFSADQAFTVSFWALSEGNTGWNTAFTTNTSTVTYGGLYAVLLDATYLDEGGTIMQYLFADNSDGYMYNSSFGAADTTWHHYVYAWNGPGDGTGDVTIYVDGVPESNNFNGRGTSNYSNQVFTEVGGSLTIGNDPNGFGTPLGGTIDNFCIWNRSLAQAEVDVLASRYDYVNCDGSPARAAEPILVPYTGLVRQYTFDDSGNSMHDLISSQDGVSNATWIASGMNGTGGLYFGAGQSATVPVAADIEFNGSQSFSIAVDVKVASDAWNNNIVAPNGYVFAYGSDTMLQFNEPAWASSYVEIGGTRVLQPDGSWIEGWPFNYTDNGASWHHYVMVYEGSASNFTLYVDGTPYDINLAEATPIFDYIFRAADYADITLGNAPAWWGAGDYSLNGTIDNFCIWNRALNSTEAENVGTVYACNGTVIPEGNVVPAPVILPFNDTVMFWSELASGGSSIPDVLSKYNGTIGLGTWDCADHPTNLLCSVVQSAGQTGLNYAAAPQTSIGNVGQSYTASMWYKSVGGSATQGFFAKWDGGNPHAPLYVGGDMAYTGAMISGGFFVTSQFSLRLTDGNWHLINFVRDAANTEFIVYVDGVPYATRTGVPDNDFTNNLPITFGGDSGVSAGNNKVSQFALINQSLSAGNISCLYNSGNGRQYADFVSTCIEGNAPLVVAPVANFTANITSGYVPLSVQFTDTSSNVPTSWAWDFGDGNTSTNQSPVHTYNYSGNFTVNLTVSNSGGSDSEVKNNYINAILFTRVIPQAVLFWSDDGITDATGNGGTASLVSATYNSTYVPVPGITSIYSAAGVGKGLTTQSPAYSDFGGYAADVEWFGMCEWIDYSASNAQSTPMNLFIAQTSGLGTVLGANFNNGNTSNEIPSILLTGTDVPASTSHSPYYSAVGNGGWHHVCVSWHKTPYVYPFSQSNYADMYIDGKLVDSYGTPTDRIISSVGSGNISFGSAASQSAMPYSGFIAQPVAFQASARFRMSQIVDCMYNGGSGRNYSSYQQNCAVEIYNRTLDVYGSVLQGDYKLFSPRGSDVSTYKWYRNGVEQVGQTALTFSNWTSGDNVTLQITPLNSFGDSGFVMNVSYPFRAGKVVMNIPNGSVTNVSFNYPKYLYLSDFQFPHPMSTYVHYYMDYSSVSTSSDLIDDVPEYPVVDTVLYPAVDMQGQYAANLMGTVAYSPYGGLQNGNHQVMASVIDSVVEKYSSTEKPYFSFSIDNSNVVPNSSYPAAVSQWYFNATYPVITSMNANKTTGTVNLPYTGMNDSETYLFVPSFAIAWVQTFERFSGYYIDSRRLTTNTALQIGSDVVNMSGANCKDGDCAEFVGTANSFMQSPTGTTNDLVITSGTNTGIISVWLYPEDNATYHEVFGRGGTTNQARFLLRLGGNNNLTPQFRANNEAFLTANSSLTQNSWNHLMVVYSSNTSIGNRIYINGVLSGNASTSMPTNTNKLVLGQNGLNTTNSYYGRMDEVLMFTISTTSFGGKSVQNLVDYLYRAGSGRFYYSADFGQPIGFTIPSSQTSTNQLFFKPTFDLGPSFGTKTFTAYSTLLLTAEFQDGSRRSYQDPLSVSSFVAIPSVSPIGIGEYNLSNHSQYILLDTKMFNKSTDKFSFQLLPCLTVGSATYCNMNSPGNNTADFTFPEYITPLSVVSVSNVTVTPTNPITTNNLLVSYIINNLGNFTDGSTYRWFRTNDSVVLNTSSVLPSYQLSSGYSYLAEVTPQRVCVQGEFNVSSGCGGVASLPSDYYANGSIVFGSPEDGSFGAKHSAIFNYTKPAGALSTSTLFARTGQSSGAGLLDANYTLPSSCWNADPNNVRIGFRIGMTGVAPTFYNEFVEVFCYNGTGYDRLYYAGSYPTAGCDNPYGATSSIALATDDNLDSFVCTSPSYGLNYQPSPIYYGNRACMRGSTCNLVSTGTVAGFNMNWVFETGTPVNSSSVLVSPPAPVANFTANQTSGYVPLTVSFNDTSTNIPTSWAWDFDNDGIVDNTTQNPIYTYADSGNFTVNLTVTNFGGSATMVKTNYIQSIGYTTVVSSVCQGLVYPNEKDLPAPAQIQYNFTVQVAPAFNNVSYTTYIKRVGQSAIVPMCSFTGTSAERIYTCNATMNYYKEAGQYTVYVNFTSDGRTSVYQNTDICNYGQMISQHINNPVLTFTGAGPNIPNIQSSAPIVVENWANGEFDVYMIATDLNGRQTPGSKLPASAFKAGTVLGSAVTLSNGVSRDTSITVPAGLNSNASVYLWLSMPLNTVPQDYYSQNAWQVSTS